MHSCQVDTIQCADAMVDILSQNQLCLFLFFYCLRIYKLYKESHLYEDCEYQLSILHLYVKLPEHRHRLVVIVAVNSVVTSCGSVRF